MELFVMFENNKEITAFHWLPILIIDQSQAVIVNKESHSAAACRWSDRGAGTNVSVEGYYRSFLPLIDWLVDWHQDGAAVHPVRNEIRQNSAAGDSAEVSEETSFKYQREALSQLQRNPLQCTFFPLLNDVVWRMWCVMWRSDSRKQLCIKWS